MPFTLDRSKDLTPQLIKDAELAASAFTVLFRKRMQRVAPQIKRDLRIMPSKLPDLPFVWSFDPVKNARARRWYFANKVDRNTPGGRYQRTGGLAEAWKTTTLITDDSGSVTIDNPVDGAVYVVGDYIVPSHEKTGWGRNVRGIVDEYSVLLDEGISEDYYQAVGGI